MAISNRKQKGSSPLTGTGSKVSSNKKVISTASKKSPAKKTGIKSKEKLKKTLKSNIKPRKRKSAVLTARLALKSIRKMVNPEAKSASHPSAYVKSEPKRLKEEQSTYWEEPWPRNQNLPDGYGDNMIYIMVRDPQWIYSYWEIQKDHQEKMLGQLGGDWSVVRSVLRVYNTTKKNGLPDFHDIILQGCPTCWTIQAQPNNSYVVEIGLLHRDGRFIALARSNEITTPRSGMSEVIDEQWMGIDFDQIYALSGGFEVGKSSADLRKLMEERLHGAITSGSGVGLLSSMGSPSRPLQKKRSFWFELDCELIVYGATEPDATVVLQGKKMKLRPDGTFSARFALPDGKQVLDAHAHSADGKEERVITPIVERKTERPAPILKNGVKVK